MHSLVRKCSLVRRGVLHETGCSTMIDVRFSVAVWVRALMGVRRVLFGHR